MILLTIFIIASYMYVGILVVIYANSRDRKLMDEFNRIQDEHNGYIALAMWSILVYNRLRGKANDE